MMYYINNIVHTMFVCWIFEKKNNNKKNLFDVLCRDAFCRDGYCI